jgi:hypothetical protein
MLPTPIGLLSFSWWDYVLVAGFSIGIAVLLYNVMARRFDDATRFVTAVIAVLVLWLTLPSLCFAVGYVLPHPYRHIVTVDAHRRTDVVAMRELESPRRYPFAVTYVSDARRLDLQHARSNDCFSVEGIQFPGGLAVYDEYRTICPHVITAKASH